MATGAKPPELPELVRAQDRLTFIYLEKCAIHRDANAITATDDRGVIHIPAASLGALLLGPGTTVTQQAMVLMAESGSTVVWVGGGGRPLLRPRQISGSQFATSGSSGSSDDESELAAARGARDVCDAVSR